MDDLEANTFDARSVLVQEGKLEEVITQSSVINPSAINVAAGGRAEDSSELQVE